jgi:hypothetical protein
MVGRGKGCIAVNCDSLRLRRIGRGDASQVIIESNSGKAYFGPLAKAHGCESEKRRGRVLLADAGWLPYTAWLPGL